MVHTGTGRNGTGVVSRPETAAAWNRGIASSILGPTGDCFFPKCGFVGKVSFAGSKEPPVWGHSMVIPPTPGGGQNSRESRESQKSSQIPKCPGLGLGKIEGCGARPSCCPPQNPGGGRRISGLFVGKSGIFGGFSGFRPNLPLCTVLPITCPWLILPESGRVKHRGDLLARALRSPQTGGCETAVQHDPS